MPTSMPSEREARQEAVEDLRRSLAALVEIDLTLTLRAEQLPDEQARGVLECILRDHLGEAIAGLRKLARELSAPRHPRRRRASTSPRA